MTTSKLLHIDFERGYGGMGVPTTWLYSQAESLSGSYRVVSDETLASVGHYMLKLYQTVGNPNGAEGRVRVDGLLSGVQYKFSYVAVGVRDLAEVRPYIGVRKVTDEVLTAASIDTCEAGLCGETAMVQNHTLSYVFSVPSDSSSVQLRFGFKDTQAATGMYVDEFKISSDACTSECAGVSCEIHTLLGKSCADLEAQCPGTCTDCCLVDPIVPSPATPPVPSPPPPPPLDATEVRTLDPPLRSKTIMLAWPEAVSLDPFELCTVALSANLLAN